MLTLLLIVMLTSVLNIQPARSVENNWWNSDWVYRRQVNITEISGYSLVNFPVEVTFRHDGNVQTDGRDIRVVENDTEIPYCITEINSSWAKVMFEINLTSLSTKNVYVYYGNPNATAPSYPLIPLTISEGNTGHAIIDKSVYIGWDYTSWGWSNSVELWNDFRVDFNGNGNLTDEDDLIKDWAGMGNTRIGGIGRHRKDIEAIGLGEYLGYLQTSVYVEIRFANASLKVYRNNPFVETVQADVLWMFSPLYDYANYGSGIEQNIIDQLDTNGPPRDPTWNIIYNSSTNPMWMAFRSSINGYVFAGISHNIGLNYSYALTAKESNDFDRCIIFDVWDPIHFPLAPYDQLPECRIYWCADNSNSYSEIEKMARIFNNQPSILVGSQEITPFLLYWLSLSTFKNDVPIISNMTLFNENKTITGTVNNVSTYNWLLPSETYYVQASIFYNEFTYISEQILVDLTRYTKLAINFLFGNLTISCLDIENRPLENCTVMFTRENEERIGYTDSLGSANLEAYYGNWTVKAYWMGVLVGEADIDMNRSKMDLSIQCNVGDFTVIVVDQYGHFIQADVTLRNDVYNLNFSGYIDLSMENITFTQIPLIDYKLTIKDDFGTQTYIVNTEQTRQIQVETLPLLEKLIYVILGVIAGVVIGSLGVWIVTKHKRIQQN